MSYTVKIDHFEGPFDLLLFFIERDELDIHDIPIAQITSDFLDYIRHLESLNIDIASEFILVAATLMRIKAKMLIPRKELDEFGEEIDPRAELVSRLLEYKRYKSILDEMRQLEEARSKKMVRGYTEKEVKKLADKLLVDLELESVDLYKMMKAFERVMARFEDRTQKVVHTIYKYDYSIKGESKRIMSRLTSGKRLSFLEVFSECENRIHAIVPISFPTGITQSPNDFSDLWKWCQPILDSCKK